MFRQIKDWWLNTIGSPDAPRRPDADADRKGHSQWAAEYQDKGDVFWEALCKADAEAHIHRPTLRTFQELPVCSDVARAPREALFKPEDPLRRLQFKVTVVDRLGENTKTTGFERPLCYPPGGLVPARQREYFSTEDRKHRRLLIQEANFSTIPHYVATDPAWSFDHALGSTAQLLFLDDMAHHHQIAFTCKAGKEWSDALLLTSRVQDDVFTKAVRFWRLFTDGETAHGLTSKRDLLVNHNLSMSTLRPFADDASAAQISQGAQHIGAIARCGRMAYPNEMERRLGRFNNGSLARRGIATAGILRFAFACAPRCFAGVVEEGAPRPWVADKALENFVARRSQTILGDDSRKKGSGLPSFVLAFNDKWHGGAKIQLSAELKWLASRLWPRHDNRAGCDIYRNVAEDEEEKQQQQQQEEEGECSESDSSDGSSGGDETTSVGDLLRKIKEDSLVATVGDFLRNHRDVDVDEVRKRVVKALNEAAAATTSLKRNREEMESSAAQP